MQKMTGIEQLDLMKEQAQTALKVINDTQIVIFVGTGTCGLAAGAGDTLEQIKLELGKKEINAIINTVGCIGLCVKEPIVDVKLPAQPRITYANVKPDMIARIIDEHIIGGKPILEWTLGSIPADW